MYKEMLRKTAIVGIPLLAITMVYTLVSGGQSCFGNSYLQTSTSAISMVPILRYYVFTAVIFALYGFSFQFNRAGSDIYHSLPVKRTDLYLSVLLATATWMGGTIILNVLEMLFMLLVSGCPFVPVYIPLSILFYFVASMMVFAATALGAALTGTIVTALASTGIILFLPRFVQFIFARGIVDQVPIVGWLDFGGLLDPSTNIVTGIVVMHSREVFVNRIMTFPHIFYSLLPTVVMLGLGIWLFCKRPSEIAHRNGGNKIWSVIMSILLAFVVLLPITMEANSLVSIYGAVLIAAALGVFFVYQLIVSSNLKRVLKTLPFFLLSLCLALGISLLIDTAADSMLNTTPSANAIESVSFRGYDYKADPKTYASLFTRDVQFTDTETKEYVAQTLQQAVNKLNTPSSRAYYEYNPYQVIEPVTIHMTNGKTIYRTIEFTNVDELNNLRMQTDTFAQSVLGFPPFESVQRVMVDSNFTAAENDALLQTYMDEAIANEIVSGYYYRNRALDRLPDGSFSPIGLNQTVGNISADGYIGGDRYDDSYTIRLDTPATVGLLMRTYNGHADETTLTDLQEVMKRFEAGLFAQDDNLSLNITVYNYPDTDGVAVQEQSSFYWNRYMMESQNAYDVLQQEYMKEYVALLANATMTDNPEGMFIRLNWYYYDSTNEDDASTRTRPTVFLHFENELDEQAFVELVQSWEASQAVR